MPMSRNSSHPFLRVVKSEDCSREKKVAISLTLNKNEKTLERHSYKTFIDKLKGPELPKCSRYERIHDFGKRSKCW